MLLQELASDYYNHGLSFSEYREKRRTIFDQIDMHFNGAAPHHFPSSRSSTEYVSNVDGITGRGDVDPTEPTTLGGTQAFSVQEVLDAQDKNI